MNVLLKAVAVVFGGLLLFGIQHTALAQEGEGGGAASAPPASAPAPDAAGAAPKAILGGEALEAELQRFWGEKRKVRVVERRLYPKDTRHELTAFGGMIPNDPFLFYYTAGARYGYFASESFCFELSYAKAFLQDTDLGSFLEDNFHKIDAIQKNDQFRQMAHLDIVWTPLYGKMAFLTTKLVHFDMGIFLGAGWLNTEYYHDVEEVNKPRHTIQANVGAGFRFHLLNYLTLKFDVHQYFFKKVQGGLSHPTMISLGLSTLLPYPVQKR